jgi:predicted nucleotidyltransferase
MLSEHDISLIAERVVDAYRPLAVGIFGSYAVGSPTHQSDLDLFVITKHHGGKAADAHAVRRLLYHVLHPLDVHVFTPDEFEDSAYDYQSFTWIIARQARLYHWDDEAEHAIPSLLPRVKQCAITAPPDAPPGD